MSDQEFCGCHIPARPVTSHNHEQRLTVTGWATVDPRVHPGGSHGPDCRENPCGRCRGEWAWDGSDLPPDSVTATGTTEEER